TTRHDAMVAAESGADYVMFGEPDERRHRPSFEAVIERVAWWAEVFEVPCVGYAGGMDEVAPLATAGAEFVALGDWIFGHERGPATAVAEAAGRLAPAEVPGGGGPATSAGLVPARSRGRWWSHPPARKPLQCRPRSFPQHLFQRRRSAAGRRSRHPRRAAKRSR